MMNHITRKQGRYEIPSIDFYLLDASALLLKHQWIFRKEGGGICVSKHAIFFNKIVYVSLYADLFVMKIKRLKIKIDTIRQIQIISCKHWCSLSTPLL